MDQITPTWALPEFVWPTVGHPGRVPLDALVPDPEQPRKYFGNEELDQLAATMEEKNGGEQREILTVKELSGEEQVLFPLPARYMIVSGERRWRAAARAGLKDIEIRVKKYKSRGHQKLDAFMLNNGRVGLSDIENALALADLMETFGWDTQEEIAKNTGESSAWVAQHLALLNLSPNSRALMDPSLPEYQRLKRGVGVYLSRLSFAVQDELTPKMPKGDRVTGTQQIRWLQEQLKGTAQELETIQLRPSTLRTVVSHYADQVERRAKELLEKKGFESLFENATGEQANTLLGRIKDAQFELADLVERVEELHKQATQPTAKSAPDLPKPAPHLNGGSASALGRLKAAVNGNGAALQKPKPAPVQPKPEPEEDLDVSIAAPPKRRLVAAPFPEVVQKHLPKVGSKNKEKTITFYNDDAGRLVTDKVTRDKYITLYDKGQLGFQVKGTDRPGWMPTPEAALEDWDKFCE
jgi:ParB family chromosome partitioning protein